MGFLDRLLGREEVSATVTSFVRLAVVGESHYQEALLAICGAAPGAEVKHECFAELVPEPDNPKDRNAVMVCIEGQCVGYLGRDDAKTWQPQLLELQKAGHPLMCHAFAGCIGKTHGNPNIGVSLKLPINVQH